MHMHVLRFSKAQLDGVGKPSKYGADFFVELVFAPVDSSQGATSRTGWLAHTSRIWSSEQLSHTLESPSPAPDTPVEGTIRVTDSDKSAYDAMLQSKSAFWEEVAKRKVDCALPC